MFYCEGCGTKHGGEKITLGKPTREQPEPATAYVCGDECAKAVRRKYRESHAGGSDAQARPSV